MADAVYVQAADFIAPLETSNGPILTAYKDIAGIWTIGYGATGKGIVSGTKWNASQCKAWLYDRVYSVWVYVDGLCDGVATTDNQSIAMVSLAYNIGNGAFKSSSVLRYHRNGNSRAAANSFLLWDKAHVNGQLVTVPGLFNRRKIELAKYETANIP